MIKHLYYTIEPPVLTKEGFKNRYITVFDDLRKWRSTSMRLYRFCKPPRLNLYGMRIVNAKRWIKL